LPHDLVALRAAHYSVVKGSTVTVTRLVS
jgi:hypothetical protein